MKKLLSLLSVLTISGTTTPTLVANVNYPYDNSDTRISFEDNHEEWGWGPSRGRIDFNVFSKKIEFTGGGYANNKFDTSVTISIEDENKNIVKTIFINKNKSLNDSIREYNLENGIDYKNGYSIDVWSEKANSTIFHYKNNLNNRVWNLSTGPHTEKFIIMNDKIWEPNILIEKFPNLISKPLIRRTSNNNQNNYAPNLVIDEWDENLSQYYDSLISVVNYLNKEGIIEQFGRMNGTYRLTNQNGYFIIGIQFQGLSNLNYTVELVFDRSNLYLQGFILREDNGRQNSAHGTYYYFSDSNYNNSTPNRSLGISHLTNVNLNFGGSYTNLIAGGDINISSQSIFNSFRFLTSFNNTNQQRINISSNLMRVILATSESLRFNNIISTIQHNNNPISWRNYFWNLLTNWGSLSQDIIRRINSGIQHGIQFHDPVNDNSSRISPALMAFLLNVRILNNK